LNQFVGSILPIASRDEFRLIYNQALSKWLEAGSWTARTATRPGSDWCACNDDIPELLSLAWTISRWEDEIICAVLTGVTNATSESLNRLAKLEARLAYGFRNPANQRRRASTAPAAHDAHHAPQPPGEHTQ
jgi:transposase